jgi:hypothetical protein
VAGRAFKFSTNPELVATATDVVALYLAPEKAMSCASKRSPRSTRWTGPRRCCRCNPACLSGAPHDYKRHGTTTLFAALEIAAGKVPARTQPRHRHQEFPRIL